MRSDSSPRILLVDDEPDILEFLSYTLRKEGFVVEIASDGIEGLSKVSSFMPQLVLLDVMMPGMDGIEVCERIRSNSKFIQIIVCFLTARSEDYSQLAGFEAGGDDYIIKPVKPKLLISRVKALLRRSIEMPGISRKEEATLKVGDVELDREKFVVRLSGREVSLPRKEFELLSLFMSRPGKVFTRSEIFQFVWGNDIIVGDRTIDVHIRKLREKIGDKIIHTIKGVGYKFME